MNERRAFEGGWELWMETGHGWGWKGVMDESSMAWVRIEDSGKWK